jgi:hypothetical protein
MPKNQRRIRNPSSTSDYLAPVCGVAPDPMDRNDTQYHILWHYLWKLRWRNWISQRWRRALSTVT